MPKPSTTCRKCGNTAKSPPRRAVRKEKRTTCSRPGFQNKIKEKENEKEAAEKRNGSQANQTSATKNRHAESRAARMVAPACFSAAARVQISLLCVGRWPNLFFGARSHRVRRLCLDFCLDSNTWLRCAAFALLSVCSLSLLHSSFELAWLGAFCLLHLLPLLPSLPGHTLVHHARPLSLRPAHSLSLFFVPFEKGCCSPGDPPSHLHSFSAARITSPVSATHTPNRQGKI